MKIDTALAAQNYIATRPATAPTENTGEGAKLRDFAEQFAATMQRSETAAMNAMTGQGNTHELVQAIAQTELAVETAVTIRDKVVEAYQEVLRMPV